MNYESYRLQLEADPEYNEAIKELQLRFDFAKSVLRARLQRGWSQTKLAKEVGTKQANISKIEAGLANITFDLAQKIINVLDISCRFDQVEPQSVGFTYSPDIKPSVKVRRIEHDVDCGPGFSASSVDPIFFGSFDK